MTLVFGVVAHDNALQIGYVSKEGERRAGLLRAQRLERQLIDLRRHVSYEQIVAAVYVHIHAVVGVELRRRRLRHVPRITAKKVARLGIVLQILLLI